MNVFYVEAPYDRGCPWKLVYKDESAVINEGFATVLMSRYDIPLGRDGKPGAINEGDLGPLNIENVEVHFSNKALRLITTYNEERMRGGGS